MCAAVRDCVYEVLEQTDADAATKARARYPVLHLLDIVGYLLNENFNTGVKTEWNRPNRPCQNSDITGPGHNFQGAHLTLEPGRSASACQLEPAAI